MWKKKYLFITIVIAIITLLISSVVNADKETELFDGEVYSENNITIENVSFSFLFGEPYEKMTVRTPSGGVIVNIAECRVNDLFRICFDHANYSHLDNKTDSHIYKAFVRIFANTAGLSIKREYSATEVLPGETIEVSVAINNTGLISANDVTYTDFFPRDFEITNTSGCLKYPDKIVWEGNINPNQKGLCSYVLRARRPIDYSSQAKLSYHNGIKTIETESSTTTLKVSNYQLSINHSVSSSNLHVEDETNLIILLTNYDNLSSIPVSLFGFKIPVGFKVINSIPEVEENMMEWKGTLKPEEQKKFNLTLQAISTGNFTIKPTAAFTFGGIEKKNTLEIPITISAEKLILELNVSKKNVWAEDKVEVTLEVKNLDEKVDFKNVLINISSDLFESSQIINFPIIPHLEKRILKQNFTILELYKNGTEKINIEVIYSWFEEKFRLNASQEIEVYSERATLSEKTNLTIGTATALDKDTIEEEISIEKNVIVEPEVKQNKQNLGSQNGHNILFLLIIMFFQILIVAWIVFTIRKVLITK